MFRRTDADLPAQASFEPDLKSLGFYRNDKGQYVTTAEPHTFFNFKESKDENYNEQRSQALHQAISKDFHAQLADMGVIKFYLTGGDSGSRGFKITHMKPTTPYVSILATETDKLKKKKNVEIIVSESKQSLGVFSWKILKTEGGVDAGSAVGLVKALRDRVGYNADGSVRDESAVPGIIILNPGELIYSHQRSEPMTIFAWKNRQRPHALSEPWGITDLNKVTGHETPAAHVATFLQHHLHKIISKKARLSFIAIGDGGENLLTHLSGLASKDYDSKVLREIVALAFLDSSQMTHQVEVDSLRELLASCGRAWEASSLPKGTLLGGPHKKVDPTEQAGGQQLTTTYTPGTESVPDPSRANEDDKSPTTPRPRAFTLPFTMPPLDKDVLEAQAKAKQPQFSPSFKHYMNTSLPKKLEKQGLSTGSGNDDQKKLIENPVTPEAQPAIMVEDSYYEFSNRLGLGRQFKRGFGHDPGFARDASFAPVAKAEETAFQVSYNRPEFDCGFRFPAKPTVTSSSAAMAEVHDFLGNMDQAMRRRQCASPDQELIDLDGGSSNPSNEIKAESLSGEPIVRDFAYPGSIKAGDFDMRPLRLSPHVPAQPIPIRPRANTAPAGLAGYRGYLSTRPPGERTIARGESPLALRMRESDEKLAAVSEKALDMRDSDEKLVAASAKAPEGAYDYYKEPMLCNTYSAGIEDVIEAILPTVFEEVMEFLDEKMA